MQSVGVRVRAVSPSLTHSSQVRPTPTSLSSVSQHQAASSHLTAIHQTIRSTIACGKSCPVPCPGVRSRMRKKGWSRSGLAKAAVSHGWEQTVSPRSLCAAAFTLTHSCSLSLPFYFLICNSSGSTVSVPFQHQETSFLLTFISHP